MRLRRRRRGRGRRRRRRGSEAAGLHHGGDSRAGSGERERGARGASGAAGDAGRGAVVHDGAVAPGLARGRAREQDLREEVGVRRAAARAGAGGDGRGEVCERGDPSLPPDAGPGADVSGERDGGNEGAARHAQGLPALREEAPAGGRAGARAEGRRRRRGADLEAFSLHGAVARPRSRRNGARGRHAERAGALRVRGLGRQGKRGNFVPGCGGFAERSGAAIRLALWEPSAWEAEVGGRAAPAFP
mmetsp:Transcript_3667/g.9534  ORF Transcript_3667/g.9534 Transcript_3667/m.9534 type:complete len:246 (+) Transcript_3667:583-1320(+)